jgi:hypothetical protein
MGESGAMCLLGERIVVAMEAMMGSGLVLIGGCKQCFDCDWD